MQDLSGSVGDAVGEFPTEYLQYLRVRVVSKIADSSAASSDVADGFAGGPDDRQITGVVRGDTLRRCAQALPPESGAPGESEVVRNAGCKRVEGLC